MKGYGTSVRFTGKAAECLKNLRHRDNLTNIISAGIILFSKLSAEEKEKAIAEAYNEEVESSSPIQTVRDKLKEITKAEQQTPGTLIEILSEEDFALADEIRKALGPKLAQKKSAKGG
jgi:hypothetical protein